MPTIPPRYYVYILCRPNGKPFYVGKGQGIRVFKHDVEARAGHLCKKCNTIRKIWRSGGVVTRYIVFTTNDEQEALDYEVDLIAMYGRETLANQTDGGDGGFAIGEETRAKIRKARARQVLPPWTDARRAEFSARITGHVVSDETRAKIGNANRGRQMPAYTEERRARIIAANTGRPVTPETRAKIGAKNKLKSRQYSTDTVYEIRQMYATGQYTYKQIAERFHCSGPTIRAIVLRISYSDV